MSSLNVIFDSITISDGIIIIALPGNDKTSFQVNIIK